MPYSNNLIYASSKVVFMTTTKIMHQSLWAALLLGCISCMNQSLHPPREVPALSTNDGRDEFDARDEFIQALEQGDVEQIKQLIATQKVNKQDINTPIPLLPAPLPGAQADAPSTSRVPRLPLERIKKQSRTCSERLAHASTTPLLFSAHKEHWEVVALLLANGADVQGEENQEAQEAFWLAADAEQWDLVKHCIENGIYVKDEVGAMVLLMAVEKKQWETAAMLIEKDIDVMWCGEILKIAAYVRQWKIVEQLMAKEIDAQGTYGRYALSAAAIARQWAIVAQLLDQGATLSRGEEDGWAFQAAVDNGEWKAVEKFIKKSPNILQCGSTALRAAAEKDQQEIIDKLLAAGVSLEQKDENGETAGHAALRAAAQQGQLAMIDKLLEAGVSLEQKDR